MTIHYLILSHTSPLQVKKLVAALHQEHTRFYVHVDLKSSISPFKDALGEFSNLYLLTEGQRESCNWGGMGIVNATLTMLKLVEKSGKEGYVVLLSGQDYPVKSREYIATYFKNNFGKDFISWFPVPATQWSNGGMDRINRYKIDLSDKRGDYVLLPSINSKEFYRFECFKKLVKVVARNKIRELPVLLQKKTFPSYLKPYGGDTWWALKTETISKILVYVRCHSDLLTFMAHSNLPDEMLFQSLVLEINKENSDKINCSLTYANWSGGDEPSPQTFSTRDIPRLRDLSPDILFARKFDIDRHPELLDRIEEEVRTAPVK